MALVLVAGVAHVLALRFFYDDAFITFRYAANLAHGHGLVFNSGERVEGYSNFLWTILLAVVIALGGRPEMWSLLLSGTIALATLAMVMAFSARRGVHPLLAGGLLASSTGWAAWATSGLETALFTACVTGGTLALAASLEPRAGEEAPDEDTAPATVLDPRGRLFLLSAVAFALGCLTRPDGPLPAACAGVVLVALAVRGRLSWPWVWAWAALVIALVLPHAIWRWSYYGSLLPNTYAVKPPGAQRLTLGLEYLGRALVDLQLWLWLAPIVLAALLRAPRRLWTSLDVPLVAAVVVPFVAYVATTGGDFMPAYRYVAPLLPLLALSAAAALASLADALAEWGRRSAGLAFVGLVAAAFVALNVVHTIRQQSIWNRGELVSVGWARQEVDDWVRIGDLLGTLAQPTDTLATTAAGAIPYRSGLYTLDMLGLNHPDLSRFRRLDSQRPGHMILYGEEWLERQPPQILLGHPLVHDTPASLALHVEMRPEWRERVMSHYQTLGLALPGQPPRYVASAFRNDVADRFIEAARRVQEHEAPRP
jgi:hypothetical protein